MTALEWDKITDRQYETGIDRGVIYLVESGDAAAWNGLVSINENTEREVKSYYQNGVKVHQRLTPSAYSAKLSAFTYPDLLEGAMGNWQMAPGVSLHDQYEGAFHLTYRTLIGDAAQGLELGYRLHLVYNLIASPEGTDMNTLSDSPEPVPFGFDLSAVPNIWGPRSVSHISFDSRYTDPELLAQIEHDLYGTDVTGPSFPDAIILLESL